MKKVFLTSGIICDKRKLELSRIEQYLRRNDYEIVDNPKQADAIVISTCGVGDSLAKISFNKINEFSKYKGKVIVTGCLPDTHKKRFDQVFKGGSFSVKHIEEIERYLPKKKVSFSDIEDCNSLRVNINRDKIRDTVKFVCLKFDLTRKVYVGFFDLVFKNLIGENHLILHTFYALNLPVDDLYLIRIGYGCWGSCTYCAVKKAVGDFKSKPFNICINEFKNGLEKGYSNFYLTAEDTGGYGLDIHSSLPALLNTMVNMDGNYKINIYALNPRWVVRYVDELEEIVKKRKIKAVCIPIQSGNPRILQLMHRYSDVEKITSAFIRLKKADPDLVLASHIMVGFPSETDQEFQETLDFITKTDLDLGFIASIQMRADTKAENIEPKVSAKDISHRVNFAQKYMRNSGYKTFKMKDGFIFSKER
jgi:tRNA A37 methylthiotransferase MiaB